MGLGTSSLSGEYDYALWLLLATTGMRRGEVCGLQWKDFDAERESLMIRRSLSVISGELILGTPKTTRSRRALSLDPVTVEALRAQRTRHAARRLAAGPDFQDGDFVVPAPRGGPLQPSAVGQRFQRLRLDAGLPYIRLHDLRHTYATLALEAGVHPKVVSERLGHAGIAITLDLYAHVLPTSRKRQHFASARC
jgi:integrase